MESSTASRRTSAEYCCSSKALRNRLQKVVMLRDTYTLVSGRHGLDTCKGRWEIKHCKSTYLWVILVSRMLRVVPVLVSIL